MRRPWKIIERKLRGRKERREPFTYEERLKILWRIKKQDRDIKDVAAEFDSSPKTIKQRPWKRLYPKIFKATDQVYWKDVMERLLKKSDTFVEFKNEIEREKEREKLKKQKRKGGEKYGRQRNFRRSKTHR